MVGTVSARVQLTIAGRPVALEMEMPREQVTPDKMLPLFRQVAEQLLDHGVKIEREAGREVSCRKGCGACCRQMVPISPTEARMLSRLVESMPEPRRSIIRERFAAARRRLDEAEMTSLLQGREQWPRGHSKEVGLAYFALGIACPFLEEESCSVYPDRPITCREYLVTSPAERCGSPSAETIQMVKLPAGPVWPAAARFDGPAKGKTPWVPLVLALDYAREHAEESTARPGPEFARQFIAAITQSQVAEES